MKKSISNLIHSSLFPKKTDLSPPNPSYFFTELANAPTDQILVVLAKAKKDLAKFERLNWAPIITQHAHLDEETLSTIMTSLHITAEDLFYSGAALGNVRYCRLALQLMYPSIKKFTSPPPEVCRGFVTAAQNGDMDLMDFLYTLCTPGGFAALIQSVGIEAVSNATLNQKLDSIRFIEEKTTEDTFKSLLLDPHLRGHNLFVLAVKNKRTYIANWLLELTYVFDYAEGTAKYDSLIKPRVKDYLNQLHELKNEAVASNTELDVQQGDTNYMFYILRYLIRQNKPSLLKEIEFLLSIPSVLKMVKVGINPDHPTELLDFANRVKNKKAVALLEDITPYFMSEPAEGVDQEIVNAYNTIHGISTKIAHHEDENQSTQTHMFVV